MNDDAHDEALQQGLGAMGRQDLRAAETSLRAAIALRPSSHQAHYLLGAALAQSGRSVEAEAAFLASLGAAPGYGIARYQLGLLQIVGGRLQDSTATLSPLTQLAEDAYLKWFAQGLIELAAGDPDASLVSLERGLALNNEIPALNDDMRRMTARIRSAFAAPFSADETPSDADVAHFLLGGYLQS